MILGKSLKRTSYDIKKHRITKFFLCHFLSLQDTFLHSLNVIKWGKPSKSKFALNSIFTLLALARFFVSTVLLSSSVSLSSCLSLYVCVPVCVCQTWTSVWNTWTRVHSAVRTSLGRSTASVPKVLSSLLTDDIVKVIHSDDSGTCCLRTLSSSSSPYSFVKQQTERCCTDRNEK